MSPETFVLSLATIFTLSTLIIVSQWFATYLYNKKYDSPKKPPRRDSQKYIAKQLNRSEKTRKKTR